VHDDENQQGNEDDDITVENTGSGFVCRHNCSFYHIGETRGFHIS
jgi:hypothetical protein